MNYITGYYKFVCFRLHNTVAKGSPFVGLDRMSLNNFDPANMILFVKPTKIENDGTQTELQSKWYNCQKTNLALNNEKTIGTYSTTISRVTGNTVMNFEVPGMSNSGNSGNEWYIYLLLGIKKGYDLDNIKDLGVVITNDDTL